MLRSLESEGSINGYPLKKKTKRRKKRKRNKEKKKEKKQQKKKRKEEQKEKKSPKKKWTTRGLKEDNLKHAEGLSEDSLVTKKTAKIWNFSNKAVTLHYQKETERRTIQGIVPI